MDQVARSQRLSKWQILAGLHKRGLVLYDVAVKAGVSQSFVSQVIARRVRPSPKATAVWRALDELLS